MSSTRYVTFVACAPRLERLLDGELDRVGVAGRRERARGGVELTVTREELWRLAHELRVADSLRVRVARVHAPDFDALQAGLRRVAWAAWLPRGSRPEVSVSCHRSALYHSDAVAERVSATIEEAWRGGGDAAARAARVYVRIVNDVAAVSVDASGELLHRRGVRRKVGDAPLRETLAAAVLQAGGVADAPLLVDPFCGSGALLVERALAAGGVRLPRSFAFELWPSHDAAAYAAQLGALRAPAVPAGLRLIGSDRDPRAIDAARANLAELGAGPEVSLAVMDVEAALRAAPAGAAIVSNPPWGRRVAPVTLQAVYRNLRAGLSARRDLGPIVMLTGDPGFERAVGGRWTPVLELHDGGLPVRVLRRDR